MTKLLRRKKIDALSWLSTPAVCDPENCQQTRSSASETHQPKFN